MTNKTESESIENTIQRLDRPWMQVGRSKACRLLRLSILRELTRAVHTLRSEFMATERAEKADDLAHRENYLNTYFPVLDLTNLGLAQTYSQSARVAKPVGRAPDAVTLPSPVLEAVGAAKFTRQDRRWENEIAQEAVRQNWEFWQFEASTEIHEVESFARAFAESIWPHGVVLFVESDGFLKPSEENSHLAYWRGRWLVVLEPRAHRPNSQNSNESSPDGKVASWHRLHPPQPSHPTH
jgi:hypothetical protein